jgi:hypothetical protein
MSLKKACNFCGGTNNLTMLAKILLHIYRTFTGAMTDGKKNTTPQKKREEKTCGVCVLNIGGKIPAINCNIVDCYQC